MHLTNFAPETAITVQLPSRLPNSCMHAPPPQAFPEDAAAAAYHAGLPMAMDAVARSEEACDEAYYVLEGWAREVRFFPSTLFNFLFFQLHICACACVFVTT